MIKILWVNVDQMGCGVYRCYVPALGLKDSGVADSFFVEHREAAKGLPLDTEEADVVIFQRPTFTITPWIEQCVKAGLPTLLELDDNLWDIPRHNPAHYYWHLKESKRHLARTLALVDRVLVSTRPLAERVRQEAGWPPGSPRAVVCPNHLHPAVWGREVWGTTTPYPNPPGSVVIGWQGSMTHDTDFKVALQALTRILDEFPHVLMRFFGCVPSSVKGVIPEHRFQWSKGVLFREYPNRLRYTNFDIGLAPITDSIFNRSKSNVKWLEYSALGIPSVASKVYPYAKSIEDGVTGGLAETPEEWYDRLRALVLSPELRYLMGQAAQRQVWKQWGPPHAAAWAAVLSEVVHGERSKHICDPQLELGAGAR